MLNTNSYDKKQWITLIIFLLLFVWRFVHYPVAEFLNASFSQYYILLIYRIQLLSNFLLVATILWLNKANLSKFRVSKSFFYIFILSGLLLSLLYFSPIIILLILILSACILYDNQKRPYQFLQGSDTKFTNYIVPSLLLLVPQFLLVWINLKYKMPDTLFSMALWKAFYKTDLSEIVLEEFIFRGMLWMYLEEKGYSEIRILYTQTFLFWIAHYYYIYNIGFFWFAAPVISYLLGVIVLRAKSLTPSTIVHYCYNLMSKFV